MDLGLKGRTALITGGSRGIGYGAARVLAAEGCHLHLASRSAADLESARRKLTDAHAVTVTCHALDLGSSENVRKLAGACRRRRHPRQQRRRDPARHRHRPRRKTWREAWDLKVFGFINLIRDIYANMCERRSGVIVNVIGVAGERPVANYIAGSMGNAA